LPLAEVPGLVTFFLPIVKEGRLEAAKVKLPFVVFIFVYIVYHWKVWQEKKKNT